MRQLEAIQNTVKHIYWTIALQGVIFIILAVLIALFPPVLFILVALALLIIGIALLALAWKIHSLWQKLPSFLRK